MDNIPIVKFNNQFWVVHLIKSGMAVLWRNGERAIVAESELDYLEK